MSKHNLFSLALAFITGVVLTWGYFTWSSDEAAPAATTQTQVLEQQVKMLPTNTVASELETVPKPQQVADSTPTTEDTSAQTADEQPLEEQLQQLHPLVQNP